MKAVDVVFDLGACDARQHVRGRGGGGSKWQGHQRRRIPGHTMSSDLVCPEAAASALVSAQVEKDRHEAISVTQNTIGSVAGSVRFPQTRKFTGGDVIVRKAPCLDLMDWPAVCLRRTLFRDRPMTSKNRLRCPPNSSEGCPKETGHVRSLCANGATDPHQQ